MLFRQATGQIEANKMGLVESLKKEIPKPSIAVKAGDHVRPVTAGFGENSIMQKYRESGFVGSVVYYDASMRMTSHNNVSVLFPGNEHNHQTRQFAYRCRDLEVVSSAEAKKVFDSMAIGQKKAETEARQKFIDKVTTKRIAVADREDWDITSRVFLNTNTNYIKLFTDLTKDGLPQGSGRFYASAVCCALAKTEQHILTFIPKDWMNYYGYNQIDLKMWLNFLTEVGTGFKYKLLDEVTMRDTFGKNSVPDSLPTLASNNHYMYGDMTLYPVLLESTGHTMNNYMNFIMLRYFYNLQYWNIPTIALQIKRALGDKVTAWEALLVAHMNFQYYDYYCLLSNAGPVDNHKVALPKKANSADEIINRLMTSTNMNESFRYDRTNISLVRKAIQSKDYDVILEHVKKWREIK